VGLEYLSSATLCLFLRNFQFFFPLLRHFERLGS
jgi:hypothetical protein